MFREIRLKWKQTERKTRFFSSKYNEERETKWNIDKAFDGYTKCIELKGWRRYRKHMHMSNDIE